MRRRSQSRGDRPTEAAGDVPDQPSAEGWVTAEALLDSTPEPGTPGRPLIVAFDNARLRRTAVMLAVLFLLVRLASWAFNRVDQLLLTLLLALIGAISMEPIIRPLQARGMRRGAAAGLVMLSGTLAMIALLAAFGGAFFSQMADLARAIPALIEDFIAWLNTTFGLTFDPNALAETLNANTSQIARIATNLAGGVVGVLGTVAGWVFQLAAFTLFAFYFAADGPKIKRAIGRRLPPAQQQVFVRVWETTVNKTGGYVVSKALLALLSTLAHALAFSFIEVPYWLPMAVWVGVTSQFLPVVGTYLGIALPILATVFTDPFDALAILIFATAYQQVENYILVPRLSRRTMDIHPAVAFGAVIAGVALFGWVGGIVAIPITAVAISVVSTWGSRYELIPQLALDPYARPKSPESPGSRTMPEGWPSGHPWPPTGQESQWPGRSEQAAQPGSPEAPNAPQPSARTGGSSHPSSPTLDASESAPPRTSASPHETEGDDTPRQAGAED